MRLRFAPSPTGYLHIGNARTAIYNYLLKKKNNAALVIRIEDTDTERSSRESELSILDDLRWLGIEWDEGPDVGGDYGPYRQSDRFDIYREYTDRLLEEGKAYHCYCTEDELNRMREEAKQTGNFEYNGRCRNLTEKEKSEFETLGRKPTVRFRIQEGKSVVVNDLIKGKVRFSSENIGGDFIIVRSDGAPIYNYIVVIDDALMKITHIIRGEDHLSNTPKQILIADALGLPLPEYSHHSLILGPDRSKLSKRHGITSVELYRKEGYLPEALVNYISMLGWATESGDEILAIDEIADQIEFSTLARSAAVFDFHKLKWINGTYIRNLSAEKSTELFTPYIEEAGYNLDSIQGKWLDDVISLIGGKCEILSDIKMHIGMFIEEIVEPDEEADAMLNDDGSKKIIEAARSLLETEINEVNYASDLINAIKNKTGLKGKKLFQSARAMLTGRVHGPELDRALPIIGFEKCSKRIKYMYDRYI